MPTLVKLCLSGIALLLSANVAFAQPSKPQPKPIRIDRTFGGPIFYQDRVKLSPRKVKEQLAIDENALKRFKNGHTMSSTANVLAAAGGFCFGYTLANILQSGEVKPALVVAGGAAIIACVPLSIVGNKQCVKAVSEYNDGIGRVSKQRYANRIELCCNNSGLGLLLRF